MWPFKRKKEFVYLVKEEKELQDLFISGYFDDGDLKRGDIICMVLSYEKPIQAIRAKVISLNPTVLKKEEIEE